LAQGAACQSPSFNIYDKELARAASPFHKCCDEVFAQPGFGQLFFCKPLLDRSSDNGSIRKAVEKIFDRRIRPRSVKLLAKLDIARIDRSD
jgi:hypothetical protein